MHENLKNWSERVIVSCQELEHVEDKVCEWAGADSSSVWRDTP